MNTKKINALIAAKKVLQEAEAEFKPLADEAKTWEPGVYASKAGAIKLAPVSGRKTINEDLLKKLGLSQEQIDSCKVASEPSLRLTITVAD